MPRRAKQLPARASCYGRTHVASEHTQHEGSGDDEEGLRGAAHGWRSSAAGARSGQTNGRGKQHLSQPRPTVRHTYEGLAVLRPLDRRIAPGTAYFGNDGPGGAEGPHVATHAHRPARPGPPQRLVSVRSPLGAPHGGGLWCRLGHARPLPGK
jgi:hypothetical protein